MSYEVQSRAGVRVAGPFSVLDTAINDAIAYTRSVSSLYARRTLVCEVDYGRRTIRAFVDGGRLEWAKVCKACRNIDGTHRTYCIICDSLGMIPDRS